MDGSQFMKATKEKKIFKILMLVSLALHVLPFSLLSFVEKPVQIVEVFLGGDGSSTSFSFDPGMRFEGVKQQVTAQAKVNRKIEVKTKPDLRPHDMKFVSKHKEEKAPVATPAAETPPASSTLKGDGKVASNGQGSGSRGSGKGGESGGDGGKVEGELQKYIREMVRKVDSKKRYPRVSQENGEEGTIPVKLIVGSSGQVLDFQVMRKSEYDRLNAATLQTIKEAGPFPPLPSSYDKPRLTVEIPVKFKIASR